jgi:2-methylcitrate dehydratase PrpD
MNWDSYGHLSDPAVRALLPLIKCEPDADAQAEFPANMAAKLTLEARGQTFTRMVRIPKGEPDNFLSDDELRSKFTALSAPVLGDDQSRQLAQLLLAIDAAPNLGPLVRAGAPAVGARLAGD